MLLTTCFGLNGSLSEGHCDAKLVIVVRAGGLGVSDQASKMLQQRGKTTDKKEMLFFEVETISARCFRHLCCLCFVLQN